MIHFSVFYPNMLTWLLYLSGASKSANAQYLFHGTSVLIYPNASSEWPSDSKFLAANFYCYFTPVGYLSFGWWLLATPAANHSHCNPRPSTYDWYEYTTTCSCGASGCRVHAINYLSSDPHGPYFEEDYVLAALDLGNGKLGELGLSYFDKAGGGYAVGTRRTLNEEDTSPQNARDCQDAFLTFKEIQKERRLGLPMELTNPCRKAKNEQSQRPLGIAV